MNKKIIVFIVICLGLGIIFLLIINGFQKNNSKLSPLLPTPTLIIAPSYFDRMIPPNVTINPENSKIIISSVEMNNFIKTARVINKEGDMQVSSTIASGYSIIYLSQFSEFLISINKSPFDQYRLQAENKFLVSLGINQQQACKLNVIITTPRFVNPGQAGQNYSLSFCQ